MTDKQKAFYWRMWRDCQNSNRWYVLKGRLHIEHGRLTEQGRQVLNHATARAQQNHRAVTMDDLRHGCHLAALGVDKSHDEFSNREFDLVLNTMRLVIDGEDLDAAERLANPAIGERERLKAGISRMAPDAVVREIAGDKFGTRLWEDLETEQIRELRMTLGHTRFARPRRIAETEPEPVPAFDQDVEQPF